MERPTSKGEIKGFTEPSIRKVLNELSEEELAEVQGASDVQVATTPMCVRLTVLPATSIKLCK